MRRLRASALAAAVCVWARSLLAQTPTPTAVPQVTCSPGQVGVEEARFPGRCVDGCSGRTWTNPGNAQVREPTPAYASNSTVDIGSTTCLWCDTYGYALPEDAIVARLRFRVYGAHTDVEGRTLGYEYSAQMVHDGDRSVTDCVVGQPLLPSGPGGVLTYQCSDLWGFTWSAADINSSAFGTSWRALMWYDVGVKVDAEEVLVSYCAVATPTPTPIPPTMPPNPVAIVGVPDVATLPGIGDIGICTVVPPATPGPDPLCFLPPAGAHESGVALLETMVIPAIGPLRRCTGANLAATYFCVVPTATPGGSMPRSAVASGPVGDGVGDLGLCNGSEQALVCTAP